MPYSFNKAYRENQERFTKGGSIGKWNLSAFNANANPYRFSSKYLDAETGFYYYGYRYYDPAMGRWLSRDPIGEQGGVNLYVIVQNDTLGQWDYLGMCLKNEYAERFQKGVKGTIIGYSMMRYNPIGGAAFATFSGGYAIGSVIGYGVTSIW